MKFAPIRFLTQPLDLRMVCALRSWNLRGISNPITMNSTSNGVTAVEVGQLVACILGVVFGLAGIATLSPGWAIFGAVLVLLGLGCFALQQALGD
jgi:hypothetical protein